MTRRCGCGCGEVVPPGNRTFCIGHWNRPCRSPEEYAKWKPARDALRAETKRVYSRTYQANRREQLPYDPIRIRKGSLWHLYRIRPEKYEAMLAAQNGVCAICKTAQPIAYPTEKIGKGSKRARDRTFCVDHVKGDGRHHARRATIRGLLCGRCNIAIGMFDHDPTKLSSAIEYLKREPLLRRS